MPIPKNWTEELVYEWLTLKGYMSECNVKLKPSKEGGVAEADVVGVRIEDNKLKIIHAEIGAFNDGFAKNVDRAEKKFTKDITSVVEELFREKTESKAAVDYTKLFIGVYPSEVEETRRRLRRRLESSDIEFKAFAEFLEEDVVATINEFRSREIGRGYRKTEGVMLPQPHWLLCLVDYIGRGEISFEGLNARRRRRR